MSQEDLHITSPPSKRTPSQFCVQDDGLVFYSTLVAHLDNLTVAVQACLRERLVGDVAAVREGNTKMRELGKLLVVLVLRILSFIAIISHHI